MKVLFIDDESDLTEQAKEYLEQEEEKLEIQTANSAEEGLKILEEGEYEAIITDYRMPKMNGLELLRNIREQGDSTYVFSPL